MINIEKTYHNVSLEMKDQIPKDVEKTMTAGISMQENRLLM